MAVKIIKPQPGPQEQFLKAKCDVVVYGGSAGGGKTFSLLLEPLYYINVPGYNATFFRKSNPELNAPGGLWDEAKKMYLPLGAEMVQSPRMVARFKNSNITFAHLNRDAEVYNWQGSQMCAILFDELTHFSKSTFFYMLSRNRSVCGVNPYIRATCNPDPSSWLAEFMSWYIDQDTGYPIPERSGKVRYFYRDGDIIRWSGRTQDLKPYINLTKEDIEAGVKEFDLIKSFTFISSSIYDNKELLKVNPQYLASLKSLPTVEREQLLYGNWKIKRAQGDYFRREWFKVVDRLPDPKRVLKAVRGWDRAATEKSENNNPDYTAGVLILKLDTDEYVIADVRRFRERPARRNELILNTALADKERYPNSRQIFEQDPGQAGIDEVETLIKSLTNNNILCDKTRPSKNKVQRALNLSAAAENGLVRIYPGEYLDDYFLELEQFSDNPKDYLHDDQIDASSCAFNRINDIKGSYDLTALTQI